MNCIPCVLVVKSELKKFGLHCLGIHMGEVEIREDISPYQLEKLSSSLKKMGLEVINDNQKIIVERIISAIVELVRYKEEKMKVRLSDYLSKELNHDYRYLLNVFSKIKGITIEQFYISQRIEMVKELLLHDELSLTQIAWKMHYSSVAHLSFQFKKFTGITPSRFKSQCEQDQITIGCCS